MHGKSFHITGSEGAKVSFLKVTDVSVRPQGLSPAVVQSVIERTQAKYEGYRKGRTAIHDDHLDVGYVIEIENEAFAEALQRYLERHGFGIQRFQSLAEARGRKASPQRRDPEPQVDPGDAPTRGVVFILVSEDDCSRDRAKGMVLVVARTIADMSDGQPIVRAGYRGNGEGGYWVGLNLEAAAAALVSILRSLDIPTRHDTKLPGDNPNPPLKLVDINVEPPAPPTRRQQRSGAADQGPPAEGQGFAEAAKLIGRMRSKIGPMVKAQLGRRRRSRKA